MLQFTPMKTAAILFTVLVVCGFAVPNFFSERILESWPAWAQRRLVLGPDLQGGTSVLLQVDQSDMRTQLLQSLRHDVRGSLHDARINGVHRPVVRGNSVEVTIREGDFEAGLTKLGELSQPFNGVRPVDVVDAGGGTVRLTPTETAMIEREQQTIDQSVSILEKRIVEKRAKVTVGREGSHRIRLQAPGIGDPRRPWLILAMMAE